MLLTAQKIGVCIQGHVGLRKAASGVRRHSGAAGSEQDKQEDTHGRLLSYARHQGNDGPLI